MSAKDHAQTKQRKKRYKYGKGYQTAVALGTELRQQLRDLSKSTGYTEAHIIRQALRRYLSDVQRELDPWGNGPEPVKDGGAPGVKEKP